MGSIPLPALDLKPSQQPDIMSQYGNLMRLQAMQGQLANQPLEREALQNQVQSSGLQVQQQQQALKDRQAITAAMQQWDGKDLDALPPLVLKNGGSGMAVMGLKQKQLAMEGQYSTIAKNDADAGTANMTTMMKKNDLVSGSLSPLIDPSQTPDAQLPQAVVSTAQDLVQRGLLDPQHAQTAQQIAQLGDPTQIRQKLSLLQKSYMAQSQIMQQAQQTAQIASENSTTAKNNAESRYYQQNGGAPGVPAGTMELNSYLKNNPGKTPQDFLLWKLQHTPSAMIMGNMLGGQQNQTALDFAANNYRQTGQMPPGLYRSPGTIQAIIGRAAQLDQQVGGQGLAANKANFQANEGSLKNLTKNYDQVQAFEQTASKNMDLLQQTAKNIPDLGARYANIPVRMLNSKMLGTTQMAAFNTALNTTQTEAAKVLNSSNATGVLSDSARHELQSIIDGNLSYNAMVASLNTLKQDMANRTQSYQMQIGDIRNRIKGGGNPTPSPSNNSSNSGMVTMRAPNGQTKVVSADQVNHYKSLGASVVQ